jgi:BMFP domain-containing protein YqiC
VLESDQKPAIRGTYNSGNLVIDSLHLNNLVERIAALFPRISGTAASDLRKNLRAMLTSSLASLDLVTREEFDVQTTVLARTRQRLEELEQQVRVLEDSQAGKK